MVADDRNPFSEIQRLVDEELARLSRAGGPGPAPQKPLAPEALAKTIREVVAAFSRVVRFEIHVPGDRKPGLSYDALLARLDAQGREFLMPTVAQKQLLAARMQQAFRGFSHVPSVQELRAEHTKQLRLQIANERFGGGGDLKLTKLTPPYAARKRRDGYGGCPIGVRTGKLLAAFRRSVVVRYL